MPTQRKASHNQGPLTCDQLSTVALPASVTNWMDLSKLRDHSILTCDRLSIVALPAITNWRDLSIKRPLISHLWQAEHWCVCSYHQLQAPVEQEASPADKHTMHYGIAPLHLHNHATYRTVLEWWSMLSCYAVYHHKSYACLPNLKNDISTPAWGRLTALWANASPFP